MPKHPYKIVPKWDRNLQTNAFRVEIIEPQPRCRLRPRDKNAEWVIEHRPFHIHQFWQSFEYCINATSCEECRFNKLSSDQTPDQTPIRPAE